MKMLKFFVIGFLFLIFLTGCTISMPEGSHPAPNNVILIQNQSQVELGLIENGYTIGKIMPRQTFSVEKFVCGSGRADYLYTLIPYRVDMMGRKVFMPAVNFKVRVNDPGASVERRMFIIKDDGMCNFRLEEVGRGNGFSW